MCYNLCLIETLCGKRRTGFFGWLLIFPNGNLSIFRSELFPCPFRYRKKKKVSMKTSSRDKIYFSWRMWQNSKKGKREKHINRQNEINSQIESYEKKVFLILHSQKRRGDKGELIHPGRLSSVSWRRNKIEQVMENDEVLFMKIRRE